MCRIALVHNGPSELAEEILHLQSNGGNRCGRIWRVDRTSVIYNRFDVTSSLYSSESFPLRGRSFEVIYNGETFGYGRQRYIDSGAETDVHYTLNLLEEYGLSRFLEHADIQGTFVIRDLKKGYIYVLADQLNTHGAFHCSYNGTFIFCQEVAIAERALALLGAPPEIGIEMLSNGRLLKIDPDKGQVYPVEDAFRDDDFLVWRGTEFGASHFDESAVRLQNCLEEATIRRLPKAGPVAVLSGGGVDSAVILAIIARHLRSVHQIDRLKVYTFGTSIDLPEERSDLKSTRFLLNRLSLPESEHLEVIDENIEERTWLYETNVFTHGARLITPNPILNTQVRHTVRMATVLADVIRRNPGVRVVLTGDVADELFAGYHSMRECVDRPSELAHRIRNKLHDLPLNDAGRFTLASLYGASAVIKTRDILPQLEELGLGQYYREDRSQEEILVDLANDGCLTEDVRSLLSMLHPVEVRTPFSSHDVLRSLRAAHPDYLVGKFDGRILSKFILRVVAHRLGVPKEISWRMKVPFNEGGSGTRNDERDVVEYQCAKNWSLFREELRSGHFLAQHEATLKRLGVIALTDNISDEGFLDLHCENLALYWAALHSGLERLLKGNSTFRSQMPDCVYSTAEPAEVYIPEQVLEYESEFENVRIGSV